MPTPRDPPGSPDTTTLGVLLERAGIESPADAPTTGLDGAVTGVAYDSRTLARGAVFVAVRGDRWDGVTFVDEACGRGASAIVAESERPHGVSVPWVQVRDARAALGGLAAAFHRNPSQSLAVIGTTGTNGKTTTTYVIASILDHAGIPTGRISSVTYRITADVDERPAERTTPEAADIQALLGRMRDADVRACAMEVSSHALALRRVDHVRFAAAVFTNLTRDHLDFHGDMERYAAAKRRLFEMLPDGAPAVVNADDPRGASLVEPRTRPVTYGIDSRADVAPERFQMSVDGVSLDTRTPRGALQLRSPLLGRSNAYNVLAAAATAVALDIPFRAIEEGVHALRAVPGRMEVVSGSIDDVTVIVDFAHTDDALRGSLETARSLGQGRLVTVFGCGGDRDASKRSLMGAVAARLSDRVVITSDNPRSEDPLAIIADVERGMAGSETARLAIVDREEAVARAIRDARPGDVVVVAGKGHERHQVIGARHLPFEDGSVARAALARRRAGARVG